MLNAAEIMHRIKYYHKLYKNKLAEKPNQRAYDVVSRCLLHLLRVLFATIVVITIIEKKGSACNNRTREIY